jgi:hypothetical protein
VRYLMKRTGIGGAGRISRRRADDAPSHRSTIAPPKKAARPWPGHEDDVFLERCGDTRDPTKPAIIDQGAQRLVEQQHVDRA